VIAVVGALPLEIRRGAEVTAAGLLDGLAARGIPARHVLVQDEEALADALERADVIALLDLRGAHAELVQVARIAASRARLALLFHGYPFCAVATRQCQPCGLRHGCRTSDRVAIYRRLAARADLISYLSPLHRQASEEFVGAFPEVTVVAPDALVDALAALAARPRAVHPPPPQFGRVLLYTHHLGLGDSVNLISFARALAQAADQVTWLAPQRHLPLLERQVPGALTAAADRADLDLERTRHDVIIEVSIRAADAFAGDIADDRWIQLCLEWQPSPVSSMHENFLALLARAGIPFAPVRPLLHLEPEAEARASEALAVAGIRPAEHLVVGLHPGAGQPGKRWALDRFCQLAARLREEHGARLVIAGGPGEDALVDAVALPGDVVSRAAPLPELAALLARCAAFVSSDSGLMHIAGAAGVPTLGIYGPTSERIWRAPHALAAAVPAIDESGRRARSLDLVSVDDVARGVAALLERVAAEPPDDADRLYRFHPGAVREPSGWRLPGGAAIAVDGPDVVAEVATAAAAPRPWRELTGLFDAELIEVLAAAHFLAPLWWRA